jgi:hypothetical protein
MRGKRIGLVVRVNALTVQEVEGVEAGRVGRIKPLTDRAQSDQCLRGNQLLGVGFPGDSEGAVRAVGRNEVDQ